MERSRFETPRLYSVQTNRDKGGGAVGMRTSTCVYNWLPRVWKNIQATGSGKTARNINLVSEFDIPVGQWKKQQVVTCSTSDLHDYWSQHKKKKRFISGFWLHSGTACHTLRPGNRQTWNSFGSHTFLHQGAGKVRTIRPRPNSFTFLKSLFTLPPGTCVEIASWMLR